MRAHGRPVTILKIFYCWSRENQRILYVHIFPFIFFSNFDTWVLNYSMQWSQMDQVYLNYNSITIVQKYQFNHFVEFRQWVNIWRRSLCTMRNKVPCMQALISNYHTSTNSHWTHVCSTPTNRYIPKYWVNINYIKVTNHVRLIINCAAVSKLEDHRFR